MTRTLADVPTDTLRAALASLNAARCPNLAERAAIVRALMERAA